MSRSPNRLLVRGMLIFLGCLGSLPAGARAQDAPAPPVKSLLLPGWGQRELGQARYADLLTATEALFWGGVVGWRAYAGWRRQDAARWAAVHAGADLDGKDSTWLRHLARYPDLATYEAAQRASTEPDRIYPPGAGWEWRWDSQASWERYRRYRRFSRTGYSLARLAVGGIIALRLAGAASALVTERSREEAARKDASPAPSPVRPLRVTTIWYLAPDAAWIGLRIPIGGW